MRRARVGRGGRAECPTAADAEEETVVAAVLTEEAAMREVEPAHAGDPFPRIPGGAGPLEAGEGRKTQMGAVGREAAGGVVEAGFELKAESAGGQRHRQRPESLAAEVQEQAVPPAFAHRVGAGVKIVVDDGVAGAEGPAGFGGA